jgi:2-polyprenyl-3-methyl-5-hydroxy-6-metoxy-1,4-benzoquinol methylase
MTNQDEAWINAGLPQVRFKQLKMGGITSYSYIDDPKHILFVMSRYKFVSKMLKGKENILEIGCGDAIGIPIVLKEVDNILAIDRCNELINDNKKRLNYIPNIEFKYMDITKEYPNKKFDGIFSIDVIEHLDPDNEDKFFINSIKCLDNDGVYILGTPNITASKYATKRSDDQHINLKSYNDLYKIFNKYFKNVFYFGMNDEIIHTGHHGMAHYLFFIGVGIK